jgi:hypothetical protein
VAIVFVTSDSDALLSAIYKLIDEGKIKTWEYDKDRDFTHATDQWRNKAWLRPKKESGRLVLMMIAPVNTKISTVVYAIYHGRFIEAVLTHLDRQFSEARATALPDLGDNIG